jgi:hypothetical protein
MNNITLSDLEGQGERAHTRLRGSRKPACAAKVLADSLPDRTQNGHSLRSPRQWLEAVV